MLRDCSDVSSRWDQQRLQSAQCNLTCWLRLPQRVSPKKTPKPPDGSGESALCDVTLPISLPGEGPRPQPGVGPAPFETLFILCPQRFFGRGWGRLFYCLQVNLHLHLLFFNVVIFLCRLVFRCTIQRFLNFCTIQLLIFCDFFF